MDIAELNRYIELGRSGYVCVHRLPMPKYPGFYRLIAFERGNKVRIEFVGSGEEEAEGHVYRCTFSSLEEAIESIEDFLNLPIEKWVNYNKLGGLVDVAQEAITDHGAITGLLTLLSDIYSGAVALPKKGEYELCTLLPPTYQEAKQLIENTYPEDKSSD